MIKRESIDKVVDIAQVEEVISDFVQLKRRGANLIGLCPFHNEKTPSFTVSPVKGIFKCFGCGESGNTIGFLMKHENLSFQETVKVLAERYNIELEETQESPAEMAARDDRESLYIANKFAQQYFANNLWENEEGKAIALSYFKERGFTKKTIDKFELGYALQGFNHLYDEAIKQKFEKDILSKAGLIAQKNDRFYDFFRARVMFPIHNTSGKVVGFGGRTLSNDKKLPKYVNTAETTIYNKSLILYGLYQGKKAIRQKDNCFITEGYTDVISLHQAGLENVVSSSGTSLTEDQVRVLKRFTPNVTLLFDGDAAGLKAALRGVDILLAQDVNVKVVALPENEDPDSLMQQLGLTRFEQYIATNRKDFILFKTEFLLGDEKEDPVKRANATREIVESIALLPDAIKRSFYVKECSRLLSIDEQLLHFEINKILRKVHAKRKGFPRKDVEPLDHIEEATYQADIQDQSIPLGKERTFHAERDVIRVLLEYGHFNMSDGQAVCAYILNELEDIHFDNDQFEQVLVYYRNAQEKSIKVDVEQLVKHEDESLVKTVIKLTNSKYELSHNWEDKHEIRIETNKEYLFAEDVVHTLSRYNLNGAMRMLKEREELLKNNENEEETLQLLREISDIKTRVKEFSDLLRMNYQIY